MRNRFPFDSLSHFFRKRASARRCKKGLQEVLFIHYRFRSCRRRRASPCTATTSSVITCSAPATARAGSTVALETRVSRLLPRCKFTQPSHGLIFHIRKLYREIINNSTFFCAIPGGPLLCEDPTSGRWTVFGVTSFGEGCGQEGKFGIYAKVPNFVKWIEDAIVPR